MKRKSKSAHIRDLINEPGSQLNTLLKHADTLSALQATVSKKLLPELREHCLVSNVQRDTLTLSTAHANWATKIRYTIPDILKALHSVPETSDIKTIRVIVIPDSVNEDKPGKNKLTLSRNTAEIINDMASTMSDPEISACLKRLSSHTAENDN